MAQLGIFAVVAGVTAGAALGMGWVILKGAFRLMEPAGAETTVPNRNVPHLKRPRLELVEGTRTAARAFGRS